MLAGQENRCCDHRIGTTIARGVKVVADGSGWSRTSVFICWLNAQLLLAVKVSSQRIEQVVQRQCRIAQTGMDAVTNRMRANAKK
jgi:hypothetical protein